MSRKKAHNSIYEFKCLKETGRKRLVPLKDHFRFQSFWDLYLSVMHRILSSAITERKRKKFTLNTCDSIPFRLCSIFLFISWIEFSSRLRSHFLIKGGEKRNSPWDWKNDSICYWHILAVVNIFSVCRYHFTSDVPSSIPWCREGNFFTHFNSFIKSTLKIVKWMVE